MTAFLPSWRAFDAYHSARLLSGTGGSGRIVALVAPPGFMGHAAAPRLALHVARRWAEDGEMVILADGCLENPRLHAELGAKGDDGLVELLAGTTNLEEVAISDRQRRLKVVPAGGRAALRDHDRIRERFSFICSEFRTHGVTFAVFASLGSDLGRWVVEECTDIVVLAQSDEKPGAFLAPDEDRVRAVLGPAEGEGDADAQLEVAFPAAAASVAAADEPGDGDGDDAAVDSGDAADDSEDAAVESEDAVVGSEDAVEAAEEVPDVEDADDVHEQDQEEEEAETLPALHDHGVETAEGDTTSEADAEVADPDTAVHVPETEGDEGTDDVLPVDRLAPLSDTPESDDFGPAVTPPRPRSRVEWKDDPDDETPQPEVRTGSPGTGTPWATPASGSPDPWALAAARIREEGAPERRDPPAITRKNIEDPVWEEPESKGIEFSVGPILKKRSTQWGLGIILVATLVVSFWPRGNNVAATPDEAGPAEEPVAVEEEVPAEMAGAEGAVTDPAATDPAATDPGAPAEGEAEGGQAPPPETSPAAPEQSAPVVEEGPPTADEAAPHPRYSAGLAALGDLDDALNLVRRWQAQVPEQLIYVAPVEVGGTVYYRLVAGLQEGSSGVAEVIRQVASATGQSGADWIVRETELAYSMGDYGSAADAQTGADALSADGIPAYVLAVDFADGSVRYRVYAGGYPNASEASYLGGLIDAAGLDAALVERRGRLPG